MMLRTGEGNPGDFGIEKSFTEEVIISGRVVVVVPVRSL